MAEPRPRPSSAFIVRRDQPLIGVLMDEDGQETVHYFTDERSAVEASDESSLKRVLDLAGAWKELDWEQAVDELDRIRHEARPTPPVDLSGLSV